MRLVLAGGGVRGAFTAGVLRAFAVDGVPVRSVFGVSAGAINGAFFAAQQTELMLRVWHEYIPTKRFISFARPFSGRPIMDVDHLLDHAISTEFPLDLERATAGRPELHVVAADLVTGQPVRHTPKAGELLSWLRASSAIPIAYNRTVSLAERELVDGSLASPFPWSLLPSQPGEPIVVVATRPFESRKSAPGAVARALSRLLCGPRVAALMHRYPSLYNTAVDELATRVAEGTLSVITPIRLSLTRVGPSARGIADAIRHGEERARAWMEPAGAALVAG